MRFTRRVALWTGGASLALTAGCLACVLLLASLLSFGGLPGFNSPSPNGEIMILPAEKERAQRASSTPPRGLSEAQPLRAERARPSSAERRAQSGARQRPSSRLSRSPREPRARLPKREPLPPVLPPAPPAPPTPREPAPRLARVTEPVARLLSESTKGVKQGVDPLLPPAEPLTGLLSSSGDKLATGVRKVGEQADRLLSP